MMTTTKQLAAVEQSAAVFFTHQPHIMLKEIKLESVRSSRYDDNIETYGDDSETCYLCGKPTARGQFVHYTTHGNLTNQREHLDTQGFFPVGSECAKKLPKSFVFK